MKVLLIAAQPKRIPLNISGVYPLPPLGLAYIAAFLREQGIEADIIDMPALDLDTKDILLCFKNNKYDLCGISCNIFNIDGGIALAEELKKISPDMALVLGGRCTAFSPRLLLERSKFDIVVCSEGERIMLQICQCLKAKKELQSVKGIVFRQGARIIENPQAEGFIDLDSLPFPARELLPNHKYRMHPPFNIYPPLTLIETSRGCNFKCIFCSLSSVLRSRSPRSVLAEIEKVVFDLGVKEIHFVDPNFTFDKQRVKDICRGIIDKRLKIHWTCKTRVDTVDKELLEAMAQAGCYMISYGVESGEQEVLDGLNKDISVATIKQAFADSHKAGIRTIAYIMIGSPGENDGSFKRTMELLRVISPDYVLFGELLPDPSSPLTRELIRAGKLTESDLFDFYVKGKDIFGEFNLYGIERKKIKQWMKKGLLGYYINPLYMLKRLLKIKNHTDLANLVKGFFLLIKDKIKKKSLLKWIK